MSWGDFYESHPVLAILVLLLGSCCGWCCLAHCVFMRLCTCLKRHHKLNKALFFKGDNQPFGLLSAHRGGSGERVENTLEAFSHAESLGINFMELDCHLSKDGEVIIAHDADLERMCGSQHQGKMLKDLNFAELPKM